MWLCPSQRLADNAVEWFQTNGAQASSQNNSSPRRGSGAHDSGSARAVDARPAAPRNRAPPWTAEKLRAFLAGRTGAQGIPAALRHQRPLPVRTEDPFPRQRRPLRDDPARHRFSRLDRLDALDRSEEHTSELQSLRHLVCRLRFRKEEHTSELQSLRHIVCRLLLENKNTQP